MLRLQACLCSAAFYLMFLLPLWAAPLHPAGTVLGTQLSGRVLSPALLVGQLPLPEHLCSAQLQAGLLGKDTHVSVDGGGNDTSVSYLAELGHD